MHFTFRVCPSAEHFFHHNPHNRLHRWPTWTTTTRSSKRSPTLPSSPRRQPQVRKVNAITDGDQGYCGWNHIKKGSAPTENLTGATTDVIKCSRFEQFPRLITTNWLTWKTTQCNHLLQNSPPQWNNLSSTSVVKNNTKTAIPSKHSQALEEKLILKPIFCQGLSDKRWSAEVIALR